MECNWSQFINEFGTESSDSQWSSSFHYLLSLLRWLLCRKLYESIKWYNPDFFIKICNIIKGDARRYKQETEK